MILSFLLPRSRAASVAFASLVVLAACKSSENDEGSPSGAGITVGAQVSAGSGTGTGGEAGTGGGDCGNQVKDGTETDVDCGGSCPAKCAVTQACEQGTDCVEGVCDQKKCTPPTCSDEVKNGDELDVDCGGTCAERCLEGQSCLSDNDCLDKKCDMGTFKCLPASCTDVILNGHETDLDCGGDVCPKCRPGQSCQMTSDCATNVCSGMVCGCPMGMDIVPVSGAGSYCIDVVEATYADYALFVDAQVPYDAPDLPDVCKNGGNDSWIPAQLWPPVNTATAQNSFARPVRYIDFCDAAGYCLNKGKRLCGSIDGTVGDPLAFADPAVDQWFNACSAQGANAYPYGNAFVSMACVSAAMGTMPAAMSMSCVGGFPGILNMSGNVAEWTSACVPGAITNCRVRGGSFLDTDATKLACNADRFENYDALPADVGIRCCVP